MTSCMCMIEQWDTIMCQLLLLLSNNNVIKSSDTIRVINRMMMMMGFLDCDSYQQVLLIKSDGH